MRLPHLVDIVRAPLVPGSYGSTDILDWGNSSTTVDVPAFVQPQASDEQVADAQRVVTRWRLFLGPRVSIQATDRVEWNGQTFEVDGDVEQHQAPNGTTHHQEALLLKVTG